MSNEAGEITPDHAIAVLEALQEDIHETAVSKGWWKEHDNLRKLIQDHGEQYELSSDFADDMYVFARALLIVSEVSEGIEARRNKNAPDDKLPQFDGLSVELADAIIRVLDLGHRFNLQVPEAIIEKMRYNKGRSYKHGGKSI